MNDETSAPPSAVCHGGKGVMAVAACVLVLVLTLLCSSYANAQEFTATSLGDYGNVTVMEVTGNFDAKLPDGTTNFVARQETAKAFFRLHTDDYDFLVVFTDFDFEMPEGDAAIAAYYHSIRNDTEGIGQALYDGSSLYGSDGKLQGMIIMGNIAAHAIMPFETGFEQTLDALAHEIMHRWGAYVKMKDADGTISDRLLHLDYDKHAAHWSFLFDTDGSVLYGNNWQDNVDGTFTAIGAGEYYSPLDLYLMGFYDKSRVPPMMLVENADIDPARLPQVGAVIEGTPRTITIEDIIAAEGERRPGPAESQKSFKMAFILLTRPGTFTSEALFGMEALREAWITRFSVLTDGLGRLRLASSVKPGLPTNPGITLPPVIPRPTAPSINDGVAWLVENQKVGGQWEDSAQTSQRDTAEAVLALATFDIASSSYFDGLQWLGASDPGNLVYLSRKIEALSNAGEDVTVLLETLLSGQNPDGGWGSSANYMSNPLDTSFALKAMAVAGFYDPSALSKAVHYLKSGQSEDGGWGMSNGRGNIEATANALAAFNILKSDYELDEPITKALAWLIQQQNPDHGFGNSPSTVYDTAMAVVALKAFDVAPEIITHAVNSVLGLQSEDGSWYGSPYQTALAVRAVWKATIDPDLSIQGADITCTPDPINTLPSEVEIRAEIRNHGITDVPEATVILYDGEVSAQHIIGEQTIAVAGQSSTSVVFTTTITDGEVHKLYFVLDPEDLVEEANESNNVALKGLYPESNYEFVILPQDILVSPASVDYFDEVVISSRITNRGTLNAYSVQLRYSIETTEGTIDIATVALDIPAGKTVDHRFGWEADRAGVGLPIAVHIDPFNAFAELSETNNTAATAISVNPSTAPNLTIAPADIVVQPSPAYEGGDANISVKIRNEGFSPAAGVQADIYRGIPGEGGDLLGRDTIPSLEAGASVSIAADWKGIFGSGEKIIYVQVDPQNTVQEFNEADNSALTTLQILSLPDLVISTGSIVLNPPTPIEGDTVYIDVTIQNTGEQPATGVTVTSYEGDIAIDSRSISSIAANSQSSVSLTYDTTENPGAHDIVLVVDPDNTINEQSETNNRATRSFAVQDADFWLTESYLSPNKDGNKDDTRLFFRLDDPQNLTVVILNDEGERIRTFSGAEFENATGGGVTWDGLDESGRLVDDGHYEIQVLSEKARVLMRLSVIVDNDRAPFIDALGTKYLLHTHITENFELSPYYWYWWSWFPDDSGILLRNLLRSYSSPPSDEQSLGLFKIPPDGQQITRLGLGEWVDDASYGSYGWHWDQRAWISPDGQKVAIGATKMANTTVRPTIYSGELWVSDGDGTNLKSLDSLSGSWILAAHWVPDSNNIHYSGRYRYGNGYRYENYVIGADGSGKQADAYYNGIWSPDDQHRALQRYDSNLGKYVLGIVDGGGNSVDVYESDDNFSIIEWIDPGRILVRSSILAGDAYQHNFIAADVSGGGHHKTIFQIETSLTANIDWVVISPSKQNIVVKQTDWGTNNNPTYRITLSDLSGNTHTHELRVEDDELETEDDELETEDDGLGTEDGPGQGSCCRPHMTDSIVWSPDETRFALGEGVLNKDREWGCTSPCAAYFANVIIITADSQKETAVPIADTSLEDFEVVSWLSDGNSILGHADYHYDSERNTVFVIDLETGETQTIVQGAYHPPELSPLGNYIAYESADGISTLRSTLNTTADLRIERGGYALTLKGIAQDLNFEGYRLEYADISDPHSWNLITPPADEPVVNDIFAMWVPPREGTFYVKLTVWDKAGNVAWDRKQVSWGRQASITGLYKTFSIFSPNGDGEKDAVELHYTVPGPVSLEFSILDENGGLLKTISKGHALAESDYIQWDGTDASGMTVPDGKYTIQVLEYKFYVDVDNTPPDVNLSLGYIGQPKGHSLSADILGHAADQNLKRWVIEWGKGYNPQHWYEFLEGEEILAAQDADGNPILNPIDDALVDTFVDFQIEEKLVGKRFRITAEDFAGNVSSRTTDFLEERSIFYKWNSLSFEIDKRLIENTYGPTTIGILETLREEIVNITIEYSDDGGITWIDAKTHDNPPSGYVEITWDTAQLGAPDLPYWIRMKFVDTFGAEYYSNEAVMNGFKIWRSCPDLTAYNAFTGLDLLSIQVQSADDPAYATWTDTIIYDPQDPSGIPSGRFVLGLDSKLRQGLRYNVRMKGITEGGDFYSNVEFYPPICPKLILGMEYDEAKTCNTVSPGTVTISSVICDVRSETLSQGSLTYHIVHQDGSREVIAELNPIGSLNTTYLGEDSPCSEHFGLVPNEVTLDTNGRDEAIYPVEAVLEFEYGVLGTQRATADGELVVDRTLGTAAITYPTESSTVCPVLVPDPGGEWLGVTIEGSATDDQRVKRYEIYYDNRISNVEGISAIQGILGTWNVTRLEGGRHPVELRVFDVAGNMSCFETGISLDTATEVIDLNINAAYFSPDGDGLLDEVEVRYETPEHAFIGIQVFGLTRNENGKYNLNPSILRTIESGGQHPGGVGSAVWDGKDDSGAVVANGNYGIVVTATDACGNKDAKWIHVGVGNTISDERAPEVALLTPHEGALYGSDSSLVDISGTIVEENLESFVLRYGAGDSPGQWTPLLTGSTLPAGSPLAEWPVGSDAGIPDGPYTLSLHARDFNQREGEATVRIYVDNTPPSLSITLPTNGGYVKSPTGIMGTAFDPNLENYKIKIAEGICSATSKWITLATSANSVQDGTLASWDVLPLDGAYCIRLSARDKIGNRAETTVHVSVDTRAPATPVLAGKKENDTAANLSWSRNHDPDLAGYNLYRNKEKINPAPLTEERFLDQNLADGRYIYFVTAVDFAGWESEPSNEMGMTVDSTGPDVTIVSPDNGDSVGDVVEIMGTAFSVGDFREYRVYVGRGTDPLTWNLIRISPLPVSHGNLAEWDTTGIAEGVYSIKIEAEDILGNTNSDQASVTIDNTPPAAPVLISATPIGSNVTTRWQANAEPDLAGYLLYRNHQLVNASGIIVGNPRQYLITATAYTDEGVPDGANAYYLVAMDESGNISNPSNTLDLVLDTHPPKAEIVDPPDGKVFGHELIVRAESPDRDIDSVLFQYKAGADSLWTDLGSALIAQPYVAHLDPATLGLQYGVYNLRAVATDAGGQADPEPTFIEVTYRDLTPPKPPADLTALTDGGEVVLTWTANSEPDLGGYNIYAIAGETNTKINPSLILSPIYEHGSRPDGLYLYEVTAVDTNGNESGISNAATAMVYTPALGQPISPTGLADIRVNGSNAAAHATVGVFVDTGEGPVPRGTTGADSEGGFAFDVRLSSGENHITAMATDTDGNVSKTSNRVTVVYDEPPASPQNLTATVSGPDITLAWTASSGPDLAGYGVYRETSSGWIRINAEPVTGTSYPDEELVSGTYTYRVTAVNTSDVESLPSNEASATVVVEPSTPRLFLVPLSAGCPVLHEGKALIAGTADPDMTVELYKNDIAFASVTASDTEVTDTFTMEERTEETSLSPDGQTLAYVSSQSLWLVDLSSGTKTRIAGNVDQGGYAPLWSYDGKKLAYVAWDSNWMYRTISIYDMESGDSERLTGDQSNEKSPSWLADGRIAFVREAAGASNVWVANPATGDVARITEIGTIYDFVISPDGTKLAYFQYPYLYVVDVRNETPILLETRTDWLDNRPDWSPDSTRLAFVSQASGNSDIHVLDMTVTSQGPSQITDSPQEEFSPRWYPDGERIMFARAEEDWSQSIWMKSSGSQDDANLIQKGLGDVRWLSTTPSGEIYYTSDGHVLTVIQPEGLFSFKDVPLESGENLFHVIGLDVFGHSSDPSEIVCIFYDTSLLPDLEAGDENITVYPPYPLENDEVRVTALIRNKGALAVEDVGVDIYLWGTAGSLELLVSEEIPHMAPGEERFVTASLESIGTTGTNTIIVYVDPEERIAETIESNNVATRDFFVAEKEAVSMTTTLGAELYRSGEDVQIDVDLINSGFERDVLVELLIEDESGAPVTLLDTISTYLPYASDARFTRTWNTGTTYAGLYRVHALLKNVPIVIAENIKTFTILPDIDVECSGVTDKSLYGLQEDVLVNVDVKNNGQNFNIPELHVRVSVVDAGNQELFTEDTKIANLRPGAAARVSSAWHTGITSPGDYSAVVEIFLDGEVVCSKAASFEIDARATLTGTIAVTPAVVILGRTGQADYSIRNTGNTDASGLVVKTSVTDPESGTLMDSQEATMDLGVNRTVTGGFAFSTQGYELKIYRVDLHYILQGSVKGLASASFSVRDGAPPVVSIISPVSDARAGSATGIAAHVSDDATGIDKVEYQIDDNPWTLLPVSDVSRGLYSATWTPGISDIGMHTIRFRATDGSKNMCEPVSTELMVERLLVANDDAYRVDEDTSLEVEAPGILENDLGYGGLLTATLVDSVTKGTLTLHADGSFTYTPNADFSGTDGFTYKANDDVAESDAASVSITVYPVNDPPLAVDDIVSTDEDVAAAIDVLANDTDIDSAIDRFTVAVITAPSHGLVSVDPTTGMITYTPDADFNGTDSFSYAVDDDEGATSNSAFVTIRVYDVNEEPVADAGPDQNAQTGNPVTLDGSNSFDPDGDLITYDWSLEWHLDAIPADSLLTDEDIEGRDTPQPSFTPDVDGLYILRLIINDGQVDSEPDFVEITAKTLNVPPNANAGEDQATFLGDVVILDGGNSEDPDNGPESLIHEWTFKALSNESELTDDDIFHANHPQASFMPDVIGTYEVRLRVFDGEDSDEDELVVTVTGRNVPPNADAGQDQEVALGDEVWLLGTASNDPDNGPAALSCTWRFVSVAGGSVLDNADLIEADTLAPRFTPDVVGSYVLELAVFDGSASDFDNVMITVQKMPLLCDIDEDGDVDRNDINLIFAARNTPVDPDDPRDVNGDGLITVNDARLCVLECTHARCMPQ